MTTTQHLQPLLQAVCASAATGEMDIMSCIKGRVQPDRQYVSNADLPGLLFIAKQITLSGPSWVRVVLY